MRWNRIHSTIWAPVSIVPRLIALIASNSLKRSWWRSVISLLSERSLTRWRFVPNCSALVADHWGSSSFSWIQIIFWELIFRMSIFTLGPFRTKSSHVIGALFLFYMLISTFRTMLTKASGIPRTFFSIFFRVNMPVHAFRITAFSKLCEEITHWHFW